MIPFVSVASLQCCAGQACMRSSSVNPYALAVLRPPRARLVSPSSSSSSSVRPRYDVVLGRLACSTAPPATRTHCTPASPCPACAAVGRSLHSFRCIAFRCMSETGQAHIHPAHSCGRSHMPAHVPPASRIAHAIRGCRRSPGSHGDEASM
jgi:hypothetical protein